MSKFTKELVNDYANKLLFELTSEENEMVLKEFDIIDATMNKINSIPGLSEIEPMTHCLDDFSYTLEEDMPSESINSKEALSNCSKVLDNEVSVPKVVG